MRGGLLADSVLRRPVSSLAVLLAGVLAIGGAASAPLLTRASEQLAVRHALNAAPTSALTMSVTSLPSSSQASALSIRVDAIAATASPKGVDDYFGPAAVSVLTSSRQPVSTGRGTVRATIGWFGQSGCEDLQLDTGRCPTGTGQVALSHRDAQSAHVGVKDTITVASSEQGVTPSVLTVTGLYRRDASSVGFVAGADFSDIDGTGAAPSTRDPLLVDLGAMQAQVGGTQQQIQALRVLRPARVGLDQESGVRAAVAEARASVAVAARGWLLNDPITGVLDRADQQRHVVAITVPIVGLQLVLIAWIGLAVLVRSVSRARASEWTLGALRGLSSRQVVTSALGGTLVVLIVSAPLGLLVAGAGTHLLAKELIGKGVRIEPWRWPVLLTAAAALVGSIAAVAAAAWQALHMPVASLLHRTHLVGHGGRVALVVETAIAASAAAACYQVVAGGVLGSEGQSDLGLLAPALASVTTGLVIARVVQAMLVRFTRRRPRRAITLLSSRRLAYAPGVLRGAVVLIAGAALAASAFNIDALAQRNRYIRAGQEVGAATVLTVRTPPNTHLLDAVRSADPSNRNAMAVIEDTAGFSGGPIIAADMSRYADIATVDPAWSTLTASQIASSLAPPTAPSIDLTGTTLSLDLDDVAVSVPVYGAGGGLNPPTAGVAVATELSATIDTGTAWVHVDLGPLTSATQKAAASIPCSTTCRLVSIQLTTQTPGHAFNAAFTLTAIATDRQPSARFAAALSSSTQWGTPVYTGPNPDAAPAASSQSASGGLAVTAVDTLGLAQNGPTLTVNDVPSVLPVLIGDRLATTSLPAVPDGFSGVGLDGNTAVMAPVGTSVALPRVGDTGLLIDLHNALLASDPATRRALVEQVWLSPQAPPTLRAALEREGLTITSTQTRSDRAEYLTSLAPARAVALAAATSAAGLALAILVAAAGLLLSNHTRLYELASLRALGLRHAVLRRSIVAEIICLLGVAILLGVAVGMITSGATVRSLPFYGIPGGPPLDLRPAVPVALILAAAAVLAALILAVACAIGLVRAAGPNRLREGLR